MANKIEELADFLIETQKFTICIKKVWDLSVDLPSYTIEQYDSFLKEIKIITPKDILPEEYKKMLYTHQKDSLLFLQWT